VFSRKSLRFFFPSLSLSLSSASPIENQKYNNSGCSEETGGDNNGLVSPCLTLGLRSWKLQFRANQHKIEHFTPLRINLNMQENYANPSLCKNTSNLYTLSNTVLGNIKWGLPGTIMLERVPLRVWISWINKRLYSTNSSFKTVSIYHHPTDWHTTCHKSNNIISIALE